MKTVRVISLLRRGPELLRQVVHSRVGVDGDRVELPHEVIDQCSCRPTRECPGQLGVGELIGGECGPMRRSCPRLVGAQQQSADDD